MFVYIIKNLFIQSRTYVLANSKEEAMEIYKKEYETWGDFEIFEITTPGVLDI